MDGKTGEFSPQSELVVPEGGSTVSERAVQTKVLEPIAPNPNADQVAEPKIINPKPNVVLQEPKIQPDSVESKQSTPNTPEDVKRITHGSGTFNSFDQIKQYYEGRGIK